jgi:hypothetical protein
VVVAHAPRPAASVLTAPKRRPTDAMYSTQAVTPAMASKFCVPSSHRLIEQFACSRLSQWSPSSGDEQRR